MFTSIEAGDIYNKNINILIGSGASADLFPTLALKVRDTDGAPQTIETLATTFEGDMAVKSAIFMHYFNTCIFPVQNFDPENIPTEEGIKNFKNYENFVLTLLGLLDRRKDVYRKINLFTTNYDGCLAFAADKVQKESGYDFVVNDGTSGFHKKLLHARNFNTFQMRTGIFERANYGIPQINVIHLHGSVYWSKVGDHIAVNYKENSKDLLSSSIREQLAPFSNYITEANSTIENMPAVSLSAAKRDAFWRGYNELPIVNPTKWKFNETVFEEHYYQMLRLLSYELEKPNSILVTFGFSFADEHILRLIQRSLSNTSLQTYICCYSQNNERLEREFKPYSNVRLITPPDFEKTNFTNFNRYVFSLKPEKYEGTKAGDLI
ncbi:hypothetical protein FEE59_24635 [Herbaspirillum sp. RU 5E]|nr:hypothetical protein [Herbaspirillum sp. RU 5E]